MHCQRLLLLLQLWQPLPLFRWHLCQPSIARTANGLLLKGSLYKFMSTPLLWLAHRCMQPRCQAWQPAAVALDCSTGPRWKAQHQGPCCRKPACMCYAGGIQHAVHTVREHASYCKGASALAVSSCELT